MPTVSSLNKCKSYQQNTKPEELKGISCKGLRICLRSIPEIAVFNGRGLSIHYLGLFMFSIGLQLEPAVIKKFQGNTYLCTNSLKLHHSRNLNM